MRLVFILCIIAFLLCPLFLSKQDNIRPKEEVALTFGGRVNLDRLAGQPDEVKSDQPFLIRHDQHARAQLPGAVVGP